ncbi:hypothetical protein LX36DRAFT_713821 [Colletotrichum falcatum]|nr:hypothetical protein LX36DRAFT_713821 [Colletotrichum falcatum]
MLAVPVNLAAGFGLALISGGPLFSGKPPTRPRPSEDSEEPLFAVPYNEFTTNAPPPLLFNNRSVRSTSALNHAMATVSGMHGLLQIAGIVRSIHGLFVIATEADARIMLPLFGYTLETLTSAAPRRAPRRPGRPPVRAWGFVGYRISYAHSDAAWEGSPRRVGVDGAAGVKPSCRLIWIDGRQHGIPEGEVGAARRHYEAYSKSPAGEGFLTAGRVFLATDGAPVDSYLEPVQDAAEAVIPLGDLGSFVLAVQSRETGDGRRGQAGRAAGAPGDESDGALRVLGSILFDDSRASIFQGAFSLGDLAKMAEVHPRHVHTGPSVPRGKARVAGRGLLGRLDGVRVIREMAGALRSRFLHPTA